MRGKILDYEAKTIRNKGREEGIAEMKAQIEERAKDMLRDKMNLSLVEKYTHLPSRGKERCLNLWRKRFDNH